MDVQQVTLDFKQEITSLGIDVVISDTVFKSLSEVKGDLVVLMNHAESLDAESAENVLQRFTSSIQTLKPDCSVIIPPSDDSGAWDLTLISDTLTTAANIAVICVEKKLDARSITIHHSDALDKATISMMNAKGDLAALLYARCMMAQDRSDPLRSRTMHSKVPDIVRAADVVIDELAQLEAKHPEMVLSDNKHLKLYLFQGEQAPHVLQEIGIGRELTFRAIGAGSGNEVDLSEEDQYYYHLTLWDKENECLVGAYRIGFTDDIIASHGHTGLYLDHIFDVQQNFYQEMGNAMELSRSFILPQYQKNPQMLDALWKGIGLTAHLKQCFTMYGSVTISAAFTPLSKAILVDILNRYHSDVPSLRAAIASKIPFAPSTKHHCLTADAWSGLGLNKLNSLIEEIENQQRNIPPLVRYYVAVGAKFLAFHVEPSFHDAIYCLLRVDLDALPARYKKRFFGA